MIQYSASLMRDLISKDISRSYLIRHYNTLVSQYLLLSTKIGPNCPNALLLLKTIWMFEEKADKTKWHARIINNEWE